MSQEETSKRLELEGAKLSAEIPSGGGLSSATCFPGSTMAD